MSKFISDIKKYEKIKELAAAGDEKAKDFLFGFAEMDDKEFNDYLATIAIEPEDEKQKADWTEIVKGLIADENEAIDGYDKAIKYITNAEFITDDERTVILERLAYIKDEELKHIEDLKGIDYGNQNEVHNA